MNIQTKVNEIVIESWIKVNQRLSEEVAREVTGVIPPEWFMIVLTQKWKEYTSKN